MAAAVDLVRSVGDTWLAIRGAFERRSNGVTTPVDLTDATVAFRMVTLTSPHTVIVNWLGATIEDAAAGLVYYAPAPADVATVGEYLAWFRATRDGKLLTPPVDGFRISIRPVL